MKNKIKIIFIHVSWVDCSAVTCSPIKWIQPISNQTFEISLRVPRNQIRLASSGSISRSLPHRHWYLSGCRCKAVLPSDACRKNHTIPSTWRWVLQKHKTLSLHHPPGNCIRACAPLMNLHFTLLNVYSIALFPSLLLYLIYNEKYYSFTRNNERKKERMNERKKRKKILLLMSFPLV